MVTSTRTRAAVARARIHAIYCGTNPMRGHESMRGRHTIQRKKEVYFSKKKVAKVSVVILRPHVSAAAVSSKAVLLLQLVYCLLLLPL